MANAITIHTPSETAESLEFALEGFGEIHLSSAEFRLGENGYSYQLRRADGLTVERSGTWASFGHYQDAPMLDSVLGQIAEGKGATQKQRRRARKYLGKLAALKDS
jgi:hypothetical protein